MSTTIWYIEDIQWTLKFSGLEVLTFRVSILFFSYSFNFSAKISYLFITSTSSFIVLSIDIKATLKSLPLILTSMSSQGQFLLIIFSLLNWVRFSYVCIYLLILDCILNIVNDMLRRLGILLYSIKIYWFFGCCCHFGRLLASLKPQMQRLWDGQRLGTPARRVSLGRAWPAGWPTIRAESRWGASGSSSLALSSLWLLVFSSCYGHSSLGLQTRDTEGFYWVLGAPSEANVICSQEKTIKIRNSPLSILSTMCWLCTTVSLLLAAQQCLPGIYFVIFCPELQLWSTGDWSDRSCAVTDRSRPPWVFDSLNILYSFLPLCVS